MGFVGAVRIAAPFAVPAPDLTVGNRVRVAAACLHDPRGGIVFADPSDPLDAEASWRLLPDELARRGGRALWGDYYWRVLLASRFTHSHTLA